MSMGNAPQGFGPQQGFGSPSGPPPKKGMSVMMILLIVFGILGGGALVCCGGCGALMYFGVGVAEEQFADQLRNNPKLKDNIGEIESFKFNYTAPHESSIEIIMFDVKGTKGSGLVTIRKTPDNKIIWAKLHTSTGNDVTLVGTPGS